MSDIIFRPSYNTVKHIPSYTLVHQKLDPDNGSYQIHAGTVTCGGCNKHNILYTSKGWFLVAFFGNQAYYIRSWYIDHSQLCQAVPVTLPIIGRCSCALLTHERWLHQDIQKNAWSNLVPTLAPSFDFVRTWKYVDTYVEKQSFNTYLSQFPANPLVEHFDLTHWGDTLVGRPCLTPLRYTLVRHSCLTLWFDTLVGHSCLTLS